MMINKNCFYSLVYIFISITILVLFSCKDDTEDNSNSGNNNGGTIVIDEDYLPRAMGNNWTYADATIVEITEQNGDDWTITNFGPISGLSISLIEGLAIEQITIKKDDGNYWVKAQLSVLEVPGVIEGTAAPIEYVILKDDQDAGESWTGNLTYSYSYANPIPGLPDIEIPPVTIPYTFTIMEKNISWEVNGVNYENVIKVNQQFDNAVGGLVSTDIYYAEGVGVIQYGTNDGASSSNDLTSYELN